MSRLSVREFVFLALLFAIAIGQWQLVLVPRADYSKKLAADTVEKQQQLQQLEAARPIAQENLSQEIERLRTQIRQLEGLIPSQDEQHQIVTGLYRQAEVNDLEMPTVRTGSLTESDIGPAGSKISEQRISLVLRGKFKNFFGFLEAVERMPKVIKVERIEMKQLPMEVGRERETRGRVEVRLEMTFFFEG